jgi:hypothetical protein
MCGADLERRIEKVMGDVNNLKRKFQKQSGTEEMPTETMYRCGATVSCFPV